MPNFMHSLSYLIIVPGIPTIALLVWTKWFIHSRDKRSRRPFDEMPRPAGWSLQNRAEGLLEDFTLYFMAAIATGLVAWSLANQANNSASPRP